MRTIFIIIIAVHALIHLMGFLKGFQLAEIKELSLPVNRGQGLIWLAAAIILIVSAIFFILKNEYWWMLAIAGGLISQILVILWWKDAWAGTMANAVILIVAAGALGNWRFDRETEQMKEGFIAVIAPSNEAVIQREDLYDFPEPVRRWLTRSGVAGNRMVRTVELTQSAKMKMKQGQEDWFDARAKQLFTTDPPGFIWTVDMAMNPLMQVSGRDVFKDGHGSMRILMDGVVPLVNADGPRIDEGTMQRYLGEMVWFPTAAFSPYLRWEAAGPNSARAIMRLGEKEASGLFEFDAKGDLLRFEAMRFYGNDPGAERFPWVITCQQFGNPGGFWIPVKMQATWHFPGGPWTWLDLRIDSIRYGY